ncbi:MAG TPA: homocysteine S-methyltransferase family protein [Chloroflexota bacterium]
MQQLLAPAQSYIDALRTRVLVFDGAMGTSIQRFNLAAEDFGGKVGCNDFLVLSKPDVIEDIHCSFLEAGADVVETCTFQATRRRLAEWGLGERTYELNYEAARLARRAADRFGQRFVAGAMGPTGMLPSSTDRALSDITFGELRELYRDQAEALLAGGVDLLLLETAQDMLELKAGLFGIRDALASAGRVVPVQAQITLDVTGRMLLGTDVSGALATLEALPCDVIGLNCSTGPEHMREPIRYLCQHSTKPVSCIPNAGLPVNDGSGEAVYLLGPEPMAAELRAFVAEFGANVIGGCCGTTPDHIRAFVAATRDLKPVLSSEFRVQSSGSAGSSELRAQNSDPRIASAVRAVSLWQEPRPLIVGERVNTQGSRKVKELLLADDYEAVVQIARGQADEGAHALDVCCALTERTDEAAQMRELVRRLSAAVEVPLVIDSTEADVIQVALEHYPGRPIVNSIHLGEADRLHKVLPLVRDHGAAVIAMCIGAEGMAKTAERKLGVAREIHAVATGEYGLAAEALIFDTLTFPLSTGQEDLVDSAVQTIDGIRDIKRELPGVLTVLGVSNVSFGLSPGSRPLLNSMFLHHALAAGLDLAIVHPSQVRPVHEIPGEERELAEDLIFNRRSDALPRFIAYFEGAQPESARVEVQDDDKPVEQRIHNQILHRKRAGIEALLDQALQTHGPVEVLNEVLLPAMKHVGDLFGAGELILPYVLQSAEVMKASVAHLEQFLEKREGYTKGKVVLATVFGDVHDIGKNLVSTILSNNGYTVYDLGKQVPINQIIDKAVEVGADAIGLSALLVSTSKQMPLCVQELHRRGLDIPVLVGGAAINPRFGHRILFAEEGRPYAPGVFYNKDAFEGLASMDALTDDSRRESFVSERHTQALRSLADEERREAARASSGSRPMRSAVQPVEPPKPPFWGAQVLDAIDLNELFGLIDRKTLFSLHWGGSKTHGQERERLFREEFEPLLASLWTECTGSGLIAPWATYGYFHAAADGDALQVEGRRFEFPRQPANDHLCLSDYFGADDVAALQFVTAGGRISQRVEELQAASEYSQMYFLHGLGVSTAEAVAEYVHRRIQRELGLSAGRGKRYSWGYPACPDLAQHQIVFDLLPARSNPDVELTELHELLPEQSTAALVVHHPQAVYFAMHDQ